MSKCDRMCRLSLDIAPRIKDEIQAESARTGLKMTQIMMKAWLIYRLVQSGDVRRYTPEGEWVKLEIL